MTAEAAVAADDLVQSIANPVIRRQTIVETARAWIGTPYRHQGRHKGRAIDCIGLIIGVGADLGVTIKAPTNYSESPSGEMLVREADQQFITPAHTEMAPGDIAVLWGWSRNEPQHFAIVGNFGPRLTMIHAFSKRRQVVEHGFDDFWSKRFVRLYNFPGTEPA